MADGAPANEVYHCLVISGGGAKGAYGAGAAKAIEAYRAKKKITNPLIYVGASAGALNAYLLASAGADEAIRFWRTANNRNILGVWIHSPLVNGLWGWVLSKIFRSKPFSIYSNKALKKLIAENVRLDDLQAPLVIAATDYTRGELRAFYEHTLVDAAVAEDAKLGDRARRLGHLRKVRSDDVLREALLASSAIPIFFPPVWIEVEHDGQMERGWYVDGGVGNHTPTREAAYVLRYYFAKQLNKPELFEKSVVYCISQDPPRTIQPKQRLKFLDILLRTQEVYHHVHTRPIIKAWHRINQEVEKQQQRVVLFRSWLGTLSLTAEQKEEIGAKVEKEFLNLGGDEAPRLAAELIEFEPQANLGNPMDFNRAAAERAITLGYTETLSALRHAGKLDQSEFDALLNQSIWEDD
ncbi:MAG: patatin-like phospholipase family protein [Hyphomonadaceae bacterium]